MTGRQWFVVGTDGLTDDERAGACRIVLEYVRPDVRSGECDLPWAARDAWSSEVLQAAERLQERFVAPAKRANDYQQTGVFRFDDRQTWQDFVGFVPQALDASVRGADGVLVSLADQAECIAVLLDDATREELAAQLLPIPLVHAPPTLAGRAAAWVRGGLFRRG